MSQPQTEFDSPWKDVIERYFEDFIQFFLPQAHGEIEWKRGFEFLDKELQQVGVFVVTEQFPTLRLESLRSAA